MRVAVIAPEGLPIPPGRGGSVQIYLDALVRAWTATPPHTLYLLSPPRLGNHSDYRSIRHVRIHGKRDLYRRRVLAQLNQLKPDIIQIENRPDFLHVVKQTYPRARIVLNLHSTTFLGPQHLQPKQVRAILRKADAVVVNSQYLQTQIERRFNIDRDEWHPHVIYPGVDLEAFTPSEAQSNAPHRPFRVLFIGRVIEQKGVHTLVRAVQQLNAAHVPVELTIVGQTPPWERIYRQRLVRQSAGLPIRWKGFVAHQDLPGVLHKHDVLACPSIRDEAFGLVNVEALAAGVPVIASRVGGIPEVVDTSCGVLVDDYLRPGKFAKAIQRLAEDPDEWHRLQASTTEQAARFTWSRAASLWLHLYRQLLGKKS